MSWITESSLNCLQKLALRILQAGAVPKHVAFIMDGNRRFARKTHVETADGHSRGFDKLSEVLKWCLDLGVTHVTVYAFSIENFKRPKDEVDALMDLLKEKLEKLLKEEDRLKKEGVNIRVIGDLTRLPNDIYKLVAKAVCMTKNNTRARLTIACSYTARDEITEAVKCIVSGVQEKKLDVSDINSNVVEQCLYTEDSKPPDLLIRTSGEIRFSDFLLWQSSQSCVYFTPVLWPEFTFWELFSAVFQYQRSKVPLSKLKNYELNKNLKSIRNERVEKFVTELHKYRLNKLEMVTQNA